MKADGSYAEASLCSSEGEYYYFDDTGYLITNANVSSLSHADSNGRLIRNSNIPSDSKFAYLDAADFCLGKTYNEISAKFGEGVLSYTEEGGECECYADFQGVPFSTWFTCEGTDIDKVSDTCYYISVQLPEGTTFKDLSTHFNTPVEEYVVQLDSDTMNLYKAYGIQFEMYYSYYMNHNGNWYNPIADNHTAEKQSTLDDAIRNPIDIRVEAPTKVKIIGELTD